MEAMARHQGLQVLKTTGQKLASLDTGLLAGAVVGLQQVDMYQTQLTRQHVEAICIAISEGNSEIRKLT